MILSSLSRQGQIQNLGLRGIQNSKKPLNLLTFCAILKSLTHPMTMTLILVFRGSRARRLTVRQLG
ncbi:hypothetical protein EBS43_04500 [bacterium]|nr:hypothetical protein [bacterium]